MKFKVDLLISTRNHLIFDHHCLTYLNLPHEIFEVAYFMYQYITAEDILFLAVM